MLKRAIHDKKDPLNTMTLTTLGTEYPESRAVILRKFKEDTLICHSDRRTEKVQQIRNNPAISWHGWHPRRRVQLRLSGKAKAHVSGGLFEEEWARIQGSSRLNYSAITIPGTKVESAKEGWNNFGGIEDAQNHLISDAWKSHFCVIETEILKIDWLQLERGKNRRAIFHKVKGQWEGIWVVP